MSCAALYTISVSGIGLPAGRSTPAPLRVTDRSSRAERVPLREGRSGRHHVLEQLPKSWPITSARPNALWNGWRAVTASAFGHRIGDSLSRNIFCLDSNKMRLPLILLMATVTARFCRSFSRCKRFECDKLLSNVMLPSHATWVVVPAFGVEDKQWRATNISRTGFVPHTHTLSNSQ